MINQKTPTTFIIISILIALVILAGVAAVFILNMNNSSNNVNTDSETYDSPGIFTSYENSLISDDKINILFFAADWCPTCNSFKRDLNASLDQIPPDIQILEIPYEDTRATEEDVELKNKYEITYQHYFVQVDGNGEMIKKWYGSPILEDVLEQVGSQ